MGESKAERPWTFDWDILNVRWLRNDGLTLGLEHVKTQNVCIDQSFAWKEEFYRINLIDNEVF
jgi:hypothetical protein